MMSSSQRATGCLLIFIIDILGALLPPRAILLPPRAILLLCALLSCGGTILPRTPLLIRSPILPFHGFKHFLTSSVLRDNLIHLPRPWLFRQHCLARVGRWRCPAWVGSWGNPTGCNTASKLDAIHGLKQQGAGHSRGQGIIQGGRAFKEHSAGQNTVPGPGDVCVCATSVWVGAA